MGGCKMPRGAGRVRGRYVSLEALQWDNPENAAGNFLLGDCFCEVRCRHGHETRLFNIGRGHFVACDRCHTFVSVGSNLMSSWREESEDIWRANSESVEGYEFIEQTRSDAMTGSHRRRGPRMPTEARNGDPLS